jgi:hypothetical protein
MMFNEAKVRHGSGRRKRAFWLFRSRHNVACFVENANHSGM